jgi:AAA domain
VLDEDALTKALLAAGVTVVIVDPVMATIASQVDIHRNNEVRTFIEPWARIATAVDGIVVGIAHLIKMPSGDIVAGINGSSAFGEVPRAVFGFAKDPNSDEGHRIMSQEKNSTGREDLALSYEIATSIITTDTGKTAEIGTFVILGPSDKTVSDVLRDGMQHVSNEAKNWLSDYLLDAKGKVRSNQVKEAARADGGFSEAKIKRAATKLKVKITDEGFPRVTYWCHPDIDLCAACGKQMTAGQEGTHLWCATAGEDGPT